MIKTSAPNEQTVEKTSFLAFHSSEPVLGGVIHGTKEPYEIEILTVEVRKKDLSTIQV